MGKQGISPVVPASKDGGRSLNRLREAIERGLNDVELAAFLNCSPVTAKRWRYKVESGEQITESRGRPKKTAGSPERSPAFLDNSQHSPVLEQAGHSPASSLS